MEPTATAWASPPHAAGIRVTGIAARAALLLGLGLAACCCGCMNNWTAPSAIPPDPSTEVVSQVPRPSQKLAPRKINTGPTIVRAGDGPGGSLKIPAPVSSSAADEQQYPVTNAGSFEPLKKPHYPVANQTSYAEDAPSGPVVGSISDGDSNVSRATTTPLSEPTAEPSSTDSLRAMSEMFGDDIHRLPAAPSEGATRDRSSQESPESPWSDEAPPMELGAAVDASSESPATVKPPPMDVETPPGLDEFGPSASGEKQAVEASIGDAVPEAGEVPQPAAFEPKALPASSADWPPAPIVDKEQDTLGDTSASPSDNETGDDEAQNEQASKSPPMVGDQAGASEGSPQEPIAANPRPNADAEAVEAVEAIDDPVKPDGEPPAKVLTAAESLVQTLELLRAEANAESAGPMDLRLLQLLEVVAHPDSQWPADLPASKSWQAVATAAALELREADADRRIEQLAAARKAIGNDAALALQNLAFCRQIDDFGVYVDFKSEAFQPGQELLLYVELENFTHEQTDKGFMIQIEGGYDILDQEGNVVDSREFLADKQTFRRPRRDYYVPYRLFVPKSIAEGQYSLRVRLKDAPSKKTGVASIALPIRAVK